MDPLKRHKPKNPESRNAVDDYDSTYYSLLHLDPVVGLTFRELRSHELRRYKTSGIVH